MNTSPSRIVTALAAVSIAGSALAAQARPTPPPAQGAVIAIVGATLIDGTGGPALPNATIIVRGKRIVAVGPRATVAIPAGAQVVDATGKYATPGFIDTNVHLSLYNNGESMVRYEDRFFRSSWRRRRRSSNTASRPCVTATARCCHSSRFATRSRTGACSALACSWRVTSSAGAGPSLHSFRTARRRRTSTSE